MSTKELDSKVKTLRELRRMADELQAEIDSLQDEIKAELTAREVDELTRSDWKISWKLVATRRFNAKAFQEHNAELYEQYLCESATRRFVVA